MKTDWRLAVTVVLWLVLGGVWLCCAKDWGWWRELIGLGMFLVVVAFSVFLEGVETKPERKERLEREARWNRLKIEELALQMEKNDAKQDGRGLPWAG